LRDRVMSAAVSAFSWRGSSQASGGSSSSAHQLDGAEVDAEAALVGESAEFPGEEQLQTILAALEVFESSICLASSLRAKLGDEVEALLEELLTEGEADITLPEQRQAVERLFARSRFLERDEALGSAFHMSLQRLQACTSKDDDDDESAELLGHILDIEYGRSPAFIFLEKRSRKGSSKRNDEKGAGEDEVAESEQKKQKTAKQGQETAVADPEAEAVNVMQASSSDEDPDDDIAEELIHGSVEERDPNALVGLEEGEREKFDEAGLLVEPATVAEVPKVGLEDYSAEVLAQVPIQGWQAELLNSKIGYDAPSWAMALASVADAKIDVNFNEAQATVEAITAMARRRAEFVITKFLESREFGGIMVDGTRRHSFMTLLKWKPQPSDGDLFQNLTISEEVLVVPARVHSDQEEAESMSKGALVEVRANDRADWQPAILMQENVQGRVWVFPVQAKQQMEVELSNLRPGFDMVAIIGEKMSRARAQLALMSRMWKAEKVFDFGRLSALELSEDGYDWGTYRRFFKESDHGDFLYTHSSLIEKVVSKASGSAVAVLNSMVMCTGARWERSCAAGMLEDLQKAHANNAEILREDRQCSLRLRVGRQSILHVLHRRPGEILPEEEEFKVLILRSQGSKEVRREAIAYKAGSPVEVLHNGRWTEATVAEKDQEEDLSKVKIKWPDTSVEDYEPDQVRFLPVDEVLVIYAAEPWRRQCAAIRFLARGADAAGDGGTRALRDIAKIKVVNKERLQTEELEQEKGSADILKKVSKRIARASQCGVEAVADCVVLHGDHDARSSAKLLLGWAMRQRGDPLAQLAKPADDIGMLEVGESEVKALTEEIVEEVEKQANVYLFVRDDVSQQQYKYGDKIEFLWVQEGQSEASGKWSDGTFIRRCVGEGNEVKVRYEHQQKNFETVVPLKHVRPEQSQRPKPAIFIYCRERSSVRSGLLLAQRTLQARLRDAVGRASTGQAWYRDKGMSGGKGKGRRQDWQKNDWKSNNRQDWGQRDDWKAKKDWNQNEWPKKSWNQKDGWDSWKKDSWQSGNQKDWKGSSSGWSQRDSGWSQSESSSHAYDSGGDGPGGSPNFRPKAA
ncbi:unnamed protein product, partial [Symbiodinium microadriaticum]